jgi:hypothetical protein
MGSTPKPASNEQRLRPGSEAALAKFEIKYLADKRILTWRLRGFWTEETALEFQQAVDGEMAKVRRTCARFACLSDTRDFPVQTEKVMDILARQSATHEGARKMAIVVSSALNTLQAQRSFSSDRVKVFQNLGEATHWLADKH